MEKYVMVIKNYFDNSEGEVFVGTLHEIEALKVQLDIPSSQIFVMKYEEYYK